MDYLAAGDSLDHFLEGFPGVSREHAVAYLEMSHKVVEENVGAGAPWSGGEVTSEER